MADQTQPWAERTVEVPPQPGVGVPPRDVAAGWAPRRRRTRAPRTEPFPAVGRDASGGSEPRRRASAR